MNKRLPVTIITGFLGAGKTTLLRHLLQSSNQRLAVMVNEFGSVGLDGDLIRSCGFCDDDDDIDNRIVELNNGCLCCTVQDDFLPTIERLLLRSDSLDGILIETSGLALPKPLLQAIHWPEIRSRVFVNGVVTLVDAQALSLGSPVGDTKALEKQREEDESLDHLTSIEDLFDDQLSCADIVLLSRSDLIDEEIIFSLKKNILKKIREGTSVLPISKGQIDPSLILGLRNEDSLDDKSFSNSSSLEHDHKHLELVSSSIRLEINFDQGLLLEDLKNIVTTFQVLRLKGRLWFPGKDLPLQVQMVGPRVSTWFERAPLNSWRPLKGGVELVVLSLKDGAKEEICKILNNRIS